MNRLLALLLLAGCHHATWQAPPQLLPQEYNDVLHVWTREGKGYDGFEHKLTVKATLLSPMMQQAQRVRFSTTTRDAPALTFFVGIFTSDHRWNDFDERGSIWRITLESLQPTTGERSKPRAPTSIVKVKVDETVRSQYPHLSVFDVAYLVHFAADAPTEKIVERLRITSSFTARSLDWTVEP